MLFTSVAWVFVVLGFLAAAAGILVFFNKEDTSTLLTKISLLGSYLQGAVASLWSLAGLLFIYVAFLGQRQQLLSQDAELQNQRRQFEMQQASILQESFETAFFRLLDSQNQIVSAFRLDDRGDGPPEGRACFNRWYGPFRDAFLKGLEGQDPGLAEQREFVCKHYEEFYGLHQAELGHYFRNLYHLVKFVKVSHIHDKRRYTSLARAQLSAYELVFLFYNGISVFGEKFKPLIEEFGLLEHLETNLLFHPSHAKFYDPEAFK